MGILISRIYDKPSTRDTLERIEQEIQNIEERRWDKIKREQFIVQILSFLPLTILIANVCIFIYPSESSWRDKILLSVPVIILNLILWVCKKIVQWYSRWSLLNEETRLRKLQKEKKRILEMVCETESYRVATELLEKYDPKQLRRREAKVAERPNSPPPLNTSLTKFTASPLRSPKTSQQQQNQHQQQMIHNTSFFHNQSLNIQSPPPQQLPVPAPPPPTPITKPLQQQSAQLNTTSKNLHNASMTSIAASSVQGRPVRPILSKDRSFIEKIVDFVVSDGPDNRFALICRFCYGHNGMSLAEEYETINFRCCYCYNLNTATSKRQQVHDQLQSERERTDNKVLVESDETSSKTNTKDDNGVKGNKKKKEKSSKQVNSDTKNSQGKNKQTSDTKVIDEKQEDFSLIEERTETNSIDINQNNELLQNNDESVKDHVEKEEFDEEKDDGNEDQAT